MIEPMIYFQYSIGDAHERPLIHWPDWYVIPFQYSIGDAPFGITAAFLIGVFVFQYSIGDAVPQLST